MSRFSFAFAGFLSVLLLTDAQATFLTRKGNKLYDDEGKEVRFTGVNWFGFETSNLSPHGLWARDWLGMLLQVKEMGFNSLRIPFCDRMFEPDAEVKSLNTFGNDTFRGIVQGAMNQELVGKKPLEVLDIIVGGCRQLGLKVILDNHSRQPDGYLEERLWYTDKTPEDKWIENWVMLAKRYKGNDAVVAFDLNNEPHGKTDAQGAQWGTGVADKDWRMAAEKCAKAIQAENPDVLIIIEGVEQVGSDLYWWGGNLTGVKSHPINLEHPEKLVYSAHEYGPEVFDQPWFSASNFPNNLPAIWDTHFGYLNKGGDAHLFIGEFGILDTASASGRAGQWFDAFLKYMGKDFSWTFWCLNPNSGDTGGLLGYDWTTPAQWKLDKLKPYMAPFIGKPLPIRNPRQARALSRMRKRAMNPGPGYDVAGRKHIQSIPTLQHYGLP
jgi:endoglucanase